MTTTSRQSTTEPKNKNKNELNEQLEEEEIHGNGDHMEGYQLGGVGERMGRKVQGLRSIIGR